MDQLTTLGFERLKALSEWTKIVDVIDVDLKMDFYELCNEIDVEPDRKTVVRAYLTYQVPERGQYGALKFTVVGSDYENPTSFSFDLSMSRAVVTELMRTLVKALLREEASYLAAKKMRLNKKSAKS